MVASLKIIEKSSSKLFINFYLNFLIILRPKADHERIALLMWFAADAFGWTT